VLFNSLSYVAFLPAVFLLYHLCPQAKRWVLLLVASYFFYACWEPAYLLLIVASTLVDYGAAIAMDRRETRREKRLFLMLSMLVNLGLLATFKYWNFFADSVRALTGWAGVGLDLPALDVLLPVGISYYTFQTLSYSIDVYRGERRAERHLGIFALYVSFFPQLVAGPIERSTRLLPQFREEQRFRYDDVVEGMRRVLWGFFKKLVIADRLSIFVDAVFESPERHSGLAVVLVSYAFLYQVYCDFSGYSDIAIGSARMMGFRLMENFNHPFSAPTIAGFWRRWNISLISWFRDYLYIPLGGSRVSFLHHQANVMVVLLVSGLWHGAGWTFVLYGALHGAYLICGRVTGPMRDRAWRRFAGFLSEPALARVRYAVGVIVTFHLVSLSIFFFRAPSLEVALQLIRNAFVAVPDPIPVLAVGAMGGYQLALAALAIAALELAQWRERRRRVPCWLALPPVRVLRWGLYYSVGFAILFLGVFDNEEFIYFQF
jgi:D-alanyl-lipoteichoic acid acyltransferase DltB (MBOAT superfamily)